MPTTTNFPAGSTWPPLINEWTRALRADNKAANTIRIYTLAPTQFYQWLARVGRPLEPREVGAGEIRDFIADVLDRTTAGNAHTTYRSLRAWWNWLVDEDEIDSSPMAKTKPPIVPEHPVPIVSDEAVKQLLAGAAGRDLISRRDTAIIRLLFDTGCRLGEIAGLALDDVDLSHDLVNVVGKGRRARSVPFGSKTGQAISRYLRVRAEDSWASSPKLWLAERGRGPLQPNGNAIKIMLRRRGAAVGLDHLHAHQFRHTLAHTWRAQNGDPTSLMRVMGWRSESMLTRYGASAADERAHDHARGMNLGDRL